MENEICFLRDFESVEAIRQGCRLRFALKNQNLISVRARQCALLPFVLFLFSSPVWAQKSARKPANEQSAEKKSSVATKAQVIGDPAFLYKEADFESEIIGTATAGEIYNVSKGSKANFRKLRLKPGVVGFISNDDIKLVSESAAKKIKKTEAKKTEKKRERGTKSIEMTRYRGPVLQYTNYAEDIMGSLRRDSLLMYGAKISGYNTLIEGDIYTESNILFHWGAPKYYGDVTREGAEGWLLMTDFLLQSTFPQSRVHMLFVGVGPMFRYSHFNATIRDPNTGKLLSYGIDEMALGAVINGGLAYQFGSYALRLDGKYIWEKQKYYAGSLAFQFSF